VGITYSKINVQSATLGNLIHERHSISILKFVVEASFAASVCGEGKGAAQADDTGQNKAQDEPAMHDAGSWIGVDDRGVEARMRTVHLEEGKAVSSLAGLPVLLAGQSTPRPFPTSSTCLSPAC